MLKLRYLRFGKKYRVQKVRMAAAELAAKRKNRSVENKRRWQEAVKIFLEMF